MVATMGVDAGSGLCRKGSWGGSTIIGYKRIWLMKISTANDSNLILLNMHDVPLTLSHIDNAFNKPDKQAENNQKNPNCGL